jgi:hypothetical protein
MTSVVKKFPWKKDKELFEEATELLTKRQYEDWVIFRFGYELGDLDDVDLIFRDKYPDATLVNAKSEEALNVEFEEYSSYFKDHGHDPKKCDLIVCAHHDWKDRFPHERCPLPVYVIGGKFFPKEE